MANVMNEGFGVSCRNIRKRFGSGEAAVEMQRMLQQWGYAHGSH